ncbi:MAG TPA: DUF167 family protein [Phycisphaerae bacterium]|nr:DUF167 family protein [Phycisphaerae bacterium]
MGCLKAVSEGVEITVKVVPGASRDRIMGLLGDALKIQVSAPPERGKANAAVVALLADALGVSARAVAVNSGTTSPRKVVLVRGCSIKRAGAMLGLDKQ